MPAILGTAFAATTTGALITAGVSGGVGGFVATGTLKGAAIGALTALAMYGVGSATEAHFGSGANAASKAAEFEGSWMHAANIGGHAAVGCVSAEAGGGKCGPGALSGALGATVGPRLVMMNNLAAGTAISAVVGGAGSVLGGGKFQNGAITGAFGYLFNEMGPGLGFDDSKLPEPPVGGDKPGWLMAIPGAENFVAGAENGNFLQSVFGGLEAALTFGASVRLVGDAVRGAEYSFGKNFRLAPWGNRTGNEYGRFPHYHRRGVGLDGKTMDGQGIGRHRPWEPKNGDKSFGDRF